MATNERSDRAAGAAREAAERREGGAAGGEEAGRQDAPGEPERAPERQVGHPGEHVPEPAAEEVPELLGERSDYPIARGDGEI